jgi:hypothetical protein
MLLGRGKVDSRRSAGEGETLDFNAFRAAAQRCRPCTGDQVVFRTPKPKAAVRQVGAWKGGRM